MRTRICASLPVAILGPSPGNAITASSGKSILVFCAASLTDALTEAGILYPIALTAKASPEAKRFAQFAAGKQAAAVFEKYGLSRAH